MRNKLKNILLLQFIDVHTIDILELRSEFQNIKLPRKFSMATMFLIKSYFAYLVNLNKSQIVLKFCGSGGGDGSGAKIRAYIYCIFTQPLGLHVVFTCYAYEMLHI